MKCRNKKGILYGVGVGPGDPELLTLKAHRIVTTAKVISYPAPAFDDGKPGESFARSIVEQWLTADQIEIPIVIPMRIERFPAWEIYNKAAEEIAGHLQAGEDVVVLCEGDPFFYGSFMYLFERLSGRFQVEIVPGISSLMASASALQRPLAARNDVLTVIPGPLDSDTMLAQLEACDAAVIIKVGRHFKRICEVVENAGLTANAGYLERVTLDNEKVLALSEAVGEKAPYFSIILIYKGSEKWIGRSPLPNQAAQTAAETCDE